MCDESTWLNRCCALEEQGRNEEADLLCRRHNHGKSRKQLIRPLVAALERYDWKLVQSISARFEASLEWPNGHPKRDAWAHVARLTPAEANNHVDYLPDPRKRPGRPIGSFSAANEAMFNEMARRIENGENPHKVARDLVPKTPVMVTRKNRVDGAVKAYRNWITQQEACSKQRGKN